MKLIKAKKCKVTLNVYNSMIMELQSMPVFFIVQIFQESKFS
jgi:hypothetical protein